MRMNAVLSNPKHPEYGQFTVPLPIPHNQYNRIMEALNAMDMGDPLARDCQMDEILGEYPILKRLEGKPVNIDELDYLAKRLDSFCYAQEGAQFQGAAVSYDYSDMTDLINLTFSCQQVTVITDFSDLEQVGRDHYMVLNGGCASKEELDALDGYETALLLIDEGNGVITPYGVRYIFSHYLLGSSYNQIADEMAQQGVRYHQHTAQWNKHMVKRILENERYLGLDGYPRLIADEEFLAVRLRRGEQNTYAPCPSEILPIRDKAVCALCGEKMARDTKSHGRPCWRCKNPECGCSIYLDDSIILELVIQKLKELAKSPERIQLPQAAPASTDALRIENELALCFNRADINAEYMKTLIMAAAAERYAGLSDPTPAHRLALLRQKLERNPEDEEALWELFGAVIAQVSIGKGGEISLYPNR